MNEPSGSSHPLSAFGKGNVVLDYKGLRFNPCDDLIFPSVIRAADHLSHPLGKYYMYYAPHNPPGGVCLAFADALDGPWKEYDRNPLIGNVWSPHYSVKHVSSPHAVFLPEASRLFLYYHGDNDTTRYATSGDGIAFEYGGAAADKTRFPAFTGAIYARVFRHESPSGRGRYVMMFPALSVEDSGAYETLGMYAAWSHDARTWQADLDPIFRQADLEPKAFTCSPFLYTSKGRHFVLYHRDFTGQDVRGKVLTDVCRVEVDADMKRIGPQELVCPRQAFGDANERAADPCVFVEGDDLYLFTSIGPRLNQRIGLVKAPAGAL